MENKTNNINLTTEFSLYDIINKAHNGEYKDLETAANDLLSVCRYVLSASHMWIVKVYDSINKVWTLQYTNKKKFEEQLKCVDLYRKTELKYYTLYDAFRKYISLFSVIGVGFYSMNNNVLNRFNGYKYQTNNITKLADNKVNISLIQFYLDFIKEVIADNNNELNEYILNWIAYIVQNPNKKTATCLVLKGAQGVGKNQFTDAICEILSGYSASNVNDINEIVGQFNSVLDGKKLIVCNEMKNVGESKYANFDGLKSVITDNVIRINEKGIPRYDAENVVNLILVSNNDYPVKIEKTDRRYVVCNINGKYRGDLKYWCEFSKRKDKTFYQHLTYYFMNRDITEFNSRDIPTTESKKIIQEMGNSVFDDWIRYYYNVLVNEGIRTNEIMDYKPHGLNNKAFRLSIDGKLRKTKRKVNNEIDKRAEFYVLRDEYKEFYKVEEEEE